MITHNVAGALYGNWHFLADLSGVGAGVVLAVTHSEVAVRLATSEPVRLNRGAKAPSKSCSLNLPARVPASTVVRMNSASNKIARCYQKAIIALPPMALDRMLAMPTASQ